MGIIERNLTIVGKKSKRVNALLDSGASTSSIDSYLAKKLGLPFYNIYPSH